MYSIGYFGNSQSANSMLTLFDKENGLIGFYALGGKFENPPFIKGNCIIFSPNKFNKCNSTNKVNFGKEIPKEYFLECNNKMRDIITFQESKDCDQLVSTDHQNLKTSGKKRTGKVNISLQNFGYAI